MLLPLPLVTLGHSRGGGDFTLEGREVEINRYNYVKTKWIPKVGLLYEISSRKCSVNKTTQFHVLVKL